MPGDGFLVLRHARRASLRVALAGVLAVSGASCEGAEVVTGPEAGGGIHIGIGHGSSLRAAVIGSWIYAITLADDAGVLHRSETIWRFGGDSTATRTTITTNITYGLQDVIVIDARWRVIGGELEITYLAPPARTARYPIRADRDTLRIGTTLFRRLPP